jgi:hypothetical protein
LFSFLDSDNKNMLFNLLAPIAIQGADPVAALNLDDPVSVAPAEISTEVPNVVAPAVALVTPAVVSEPVSGTRPEISTGVPNLVAPAVALAVAGEPATNQTKKVKRQKQMQSNFRRLHQGFLSKGQNANSPIENEEPPAEPPKLETRKPSRPFKPGTPWWPNYHSGDDVDPEMPDTKDTHIQSWDDIFDSLDSEASTTLQNFLQLLATIDDYTKSAVIELISDEVPFLSPDDGYSEESSASELFASALTLDRGILAPLFVPQRGPTDEAALAEPDTTSDSDFRQGFPVKSNKGKTVKLYNFFKAAIDLDEEAKSAIRTILKPTPSKPSTSKLKPRQFEDDRFGGAEEEHNFEGEDVNLPLDDYLAMVKELENQPKDIDNLLFEHFDGDSWVDAPSADYDLAETYTYKDNPDYVENADFSRLAWRREAAPKARGLSKEPAVSASLKEINQALDDIKLQVTNLVEIVTNITNLFSLPTGIEDDGDIGKQPLLDPSKIVANLGSFIHGMSEERNIMPRQLIVPDITDPLVAASVAPVVPVQPAEVDGLSNEPSVSDLLKQILQSLTDLNLQVTKLVENSTPALPVEPAALFPEEVTPPIVPVIGTDSTPELLVASISIPAPLISPIVSPPIPPAPLISPLVSLPIAPVPLVSPPIIPTPLVSPPIAPAPLVSLPIAPAPLESPPIAPAPLESSPVALAALVSPPIAPGPPVSPIVPVPPVPSADIINPFNKTAVPEPGVQVPPIVPVAPVVPSNTTVVGDVVTPKPGVQVPPIVPVAPVAPSNKTAIGKAVANETAIGGVVAPKPPVPHISIASLLNDTDIGDIDIPEPEDAVAIPKPKPIPSNIDLSDVKKSKPKPKPKPGNSGGKFKDAIKVSPAEMQEVNGPATGEGVKGPGPGDMLK